MPCLRWTSLGPIGVGLITTNDLDERKTKLPAVTTENIGRGRIYNASLQRNKTVISSFLLRSPSLERITIHVWTNNDSKCKLALKKLRNRRGAIGQENLRSRFQSKLHSAGRCTSSSKNSVFRCKFNRSSALEFNFESEFDFESCSKSPYIFFSRLKIHDEFL